MEYGEIIEQGSPQELMSDAKFERCKNFIGQFDGVNGD